MDGQLCIIRHCFCPTMHNSTLLNILIGTQLTNSKQPDNVIYSNSVAYMKKSEIHGYGIIKKIYFNSFNLIN
jgi:hypothetical protein